MEPFALADFPLGSPLGKQDMRKFERYLDRLKFFFNCGFVKLDFTPLPAPSLSCRLHITLFKTAGKTWLNASWLEVSNAFASADTDSLFMHPWVSTTFPWVSLAVCAEQVQGSSASCANAGAESEIGPGWSRGQRFWDILTTTHILLLSCSPCTCFIGLVGEEIKIKPQFCNFHTWYTDAAL